MSHDEIVALLPWYATGTLDIRDKERIEAAVGKARALLREFKRAEEERLETIHSNEAVGAPPARVLANLLGAIEAEPASRRGLSAKPTGGLTRLFLALSPRTLAWSAMAGTAVMLLQAGVIASVLLFGSHAGPTLSNLPSGEGKAFVRFTPKATAAEIAQYLDRYQVQVVNGPIYGDLYEIRLPVTGSAELDLIEQMRRNAIVVLIGSK